MHSLCYPGRQESGREGAVPAAPWSTATVVSSSDTLFFLYDFILAHVGTFLCLTLSAISAFSSHMNIFFRLSDGFPPALSQQFPQKSEPWLCSCPVSAMGLVSLEQTPEQTSGQRESHSSFLALRWLTEEEMVQFKVSIKSIGLSISCSAVTYMLTLTL